MRLTKSQQNRIKKMHADQTPVRAISRKLGISRPAIKRCIAGTPYQPMPKLSDAGRFLEENAREIGEMYAGCGYRCPPLVQAITDRWNIEIPLRMLQRFCKPLREQHAKAVRRREAKKA